MKRSIPILLYHHVSPDREITPDVLEKQLRHLLNDGFESLSMEDVLATVEGRRHSQKPGFAVTFDDGYLDNWLCAFPVLQKLGVKAAFYLVTDRVESHAAPRRMPGSLDTRSHERDSGGFMSWP